MNSVKKGLSVRPHYSTIIGKSRNLHAKKIVKIQIQKYKYPLGLCVTRIRKLMDSTIEKCLATLAKYPQMKKEVLRLMTEELDKNEKKTNQELDNFIENLKAFMDVGHPDFTGKPDFSAGSRTTSKLGLPYSMTVRVLITYF